MITINNNNRGNINYESLLLVLHTPSMLNNSDIINRKFCKNNDMLCESFLLHR